MFSSWQMERTRGSLSVNRRITSCVSSFEALSQMITCRSFHVWSMALWIAFLRVSGLLYVGMKRVILGVILFRRVIQQSCSIFMPISYRFCIDCVLWHAMDFRVLVKYFFKYSIGCVQFLWRACCHIQKHHCTRKAEIAPKLFGSKMSPSMITCIEKIRNKSSSGSSDIFLNKLSDFFLV